MIVRCTYLLDTVRCVERSLPEHFPQPQGFRLCVTGGRDIDDLGYVWALLDTIHGMPAAMGGDGPIVEIGAGCARGVDTLALQWADRNGVPWRRYVADWDRIGHEAGSARNIAMLEDFRPDKLAVYDGGVGTTHCTRSARKLGIERIIHQRGLDDPFADALKWG